MKKVLISLLVVMSLAVFLFASAAATAKYDYRSVVITASNGTIIKKPKAQFRATVYKPDGSIRTQVESPQGNDLGDPPTISAYVGDTIKLTDLSTPVQTGAVLNAWDLQYYGAGLNYFSVLPGGINGYTITPTSPGTLDIYLNVRNNASGIQMAAWSENGNYRTVGTVYSPDGMWWYFSQVRILLSNVPATPTPTPTPYPTPTPRPPATPLPTPDPGAQPPTSPQYHWMTLSSKFTTNGLRNVSQLGDTKLANRMPAYPINQTGKPSTTTNEWDNVSYSLNTTNIYPILNTSRAADGRLIIDASSSYAIIGGQRANIGESGLDYGIYLEIFNDLTYSQAAWNKNWSYNFKALGQNWNTKSKVDWGYLNDSYGTTDVNGNLEIYTRLFFDSYRSTYEKNGHTLPFWIYPFSTSGLGQTNFKLDDAGCSASSYYITLVLYTSDGKYNAVSKQISR